MHCPECGAELNDAARYCDQCGGQIATGIGPVPDAPSDRRSTNRLGKLALALAVLAVLVVLATVRFVPLATSPLPRVPRIAGETLRDAQSELARLGLEMLVSEERFDDVVEQGRVLSQSPEPSRRAPRNRRVEVIVSLGKGVIVPDVAGRSVDDARAALARLGLLTDVKEQGESSAFIARDAVLASHPPPGARVRKGGSVALTLSSGLPRPSVLDLTGKSGEDAKALLRSEGLEYEVGAKDFSNSVPRGYVLWQRPQGGSALPSDRKVSVVLSLGRGVQVPDIVGRSEQDARNALTQVGLAIRVSRQYASAPAGRVVGSTPGPGHKVAVGGTVTLRVSKGPGGEGFLRVEVEPRTREVWLYVDGGDTHGKCPLTVRLPSGRHSVILWAPHQRRRLEFTVDIDTARTLTVRRRFR